VSSGLLKDLADAGQARCDLLDGNGRNALTRLPEPAIQQLRWHLLNHKDVIDHAGIDGAPRHTFMSGCFGTLGHCKPAVPLDRA
jgi:hypothetical protein